MPGGVAPGNGIAQAIGIGIDPACAKGAQGIRAVKTHHAGVVGSVAIAQQVPACVFFAYFAVEPCDAEQRVIAVTFSVGAVDRCSQLVLLELSEHALVRIRQQQQGFCRFSDGLLADGLLVYVQKLSTSVVLHRAAQLLVLIKTQYFAVTAIAGGGQMIMAVVSVCADRLTRRFFHP